MIVSFVSIPWPGGEEDEEDEEAERPEDGGRKRYEGTLATLGRSGGGVGPKKRRSESERERK